MCWAARISHEKDQNLARKGVKESCSKFSKDQIVNPCQVSNVDRIRDQEEQMDSTLRDEMTYSNFQRHRMHLLRAAKGFSFLKTYMFHFL